MATVLEFLAELEGLGYDSADIAIHFTRAAAVAAGEILAELRNPDTGELAFLVHVGHGE